MLVQHVMSFALPEYYFAIFAHTFSTNTFHFSQTFFHFCNKITKKVTDILKKTLHFANAAFLPKFILLLFFLKFAGCHTNDPFKGPSK